MLARVGRTHENTRLNDPWGGGMGGSRTPPPRTPLFFALAPPAPDLGSAGRRSGFRPPRRPRRTARASAGRPTGGRHRQIAAVFRAARHCKDLLRAASCGKRDMVKMVRARKDVPRPLSMLHLRARAF